VHATVIDNILTQNFLTRPNWSKTYDLLAIITLGVLIGIALPRIGVLKGLLCATGLGVLYLGIACWWFVHAGVWLTLVYPLLALSTNYLGLSFNRIAQQLRQAFHDLQSELEERRRAEEALRQSEAHYRALVEGSLQGIAIVKRDGPRVFANSALARMWGYEGPTDYTMPTMTGEVLAHELRRIRPDLPIILYTGFSDTMTAERAQALGIDGFVRKPLTVRDFNLAIRQVLAQRLAREM
jgi:PAS domain-containing protein